jgi:hypothetical protein
LILKIYFDLIRVVDPDPGSRVLMTKITKQFSFKNIIFVYKKIAAFLFLGLREGLSIYRRSLQPFQREHPALQNMKFLTFFLINFTFVDHFALLDPNPTDQNESESGSAST